MGNEKLLAAVERVREMKAKAEAAGALARAARAAFNEAQESSYAADDEWHKAEKALLEVVRG